jgi:hypothetical protein
MMRLEELFFVTIWLAMAFLVIPTLFLGVLALFEGFPRIRLGQICGIVAVFAWFFGLISIEWQARAAYLTLSVVIALLVFFGLWRREFRLLMLRRDDEFPGRLDKIGWFLMLTVAAPAGVWLYRSYRKARWPETSGAGRWDVDGQVVTGRREKSSPWDEDEVPSSSRAGVELGG